MTSFTSSFFPKRKFYILLVAAAISAASVAGPLHTHLTYVMPIENYYDIEYAIADIHTSPVDSSHDNFAALGSVTLLDDGSIDAVFEPDPRMKAFRDVPHFEHSENIQVGQTFAVTCSNSADGTSPTSLGLLQYTGLTYVDGTAEHTFYHVGVVLQSNMPCDYQQVIPASVGIVELREERYRFKMLHSHGDKIERLYRAAGNSDSLTPTKSIEALHLNLEDALRNVLDLKAHVVLVDFGSKAPESTLCGSPDVIAFHMHLTRDSEQYTSFMEKYSDYPIEFTLRDDRPEAGFLYGFTAHSGDGQRATLYVPLDQCHADRDFEDYILACDGTQIRGKEPFTTSLASEEFCRVV